MPEVVDIENTLHALQAEVGGYIETFPSMYRDVIIIINEEGMLKGLEPNMTIMGEPLVGNMLFVGTYGDEFIDIPDEQIEFIMDDLKEELTEPHILTKDDTYGLSGFWISTNTALPDPEEDGDVIVCYSGWHGIRTCYDHAIGMADYYGKDEGGWEITGNSTLKDLVVHAWMPAPDPYKGGEN